MAEFVTPAGVTVQCAPEVAARLGYKPKEKPKPKRTKKKPEPETSEPDDE